MWRHECSPHRLRRPRACAGLEACRLAAADEALCRARQSGHRQGGRTRRARYRRPCGRRCVLPATRRSIWSSSGPKGRWSPGSATICGRRASRSSGRRRLPRSSKARRASPRISAPDTEFRPPPTAASRDADAAKAYVREAGRADRGQGRRPCRGQGRDGRDDARRRRLQAIDACFDGAFGGAGAEVVVEEFLTGEEASFFCLCDGATALPFGTAQDHKRVGEGDTGPNTGGMGAYSPAPVMTPEMIERTMTEIIEPTMRGMAEMGAPFSGVLFAGLMITRDGSEAHRIQCPLRRSRMPGADDAAEGRPAGPAGGRGRRPACAYVGALARRCGADRGHGGGRLSRHAAERARQSGAWTRPRRAGAEIFHAGTAERDGGIVANGGRVLNVTAMAKTVTQARREGLCGGRPDRLAGRVLPPRHRLAGGRAGSGRVERAASGQRFVASVELPEQENRQVLA